MGEDLRELEERLQGLVPRTLSPESEARLHEQIDTLAAQAGQDAPSSRSRWMGWGAVAGIALLAGVLWHTPPGVVETVSSPPEAEAEEPLVELVSTMRQVTERVDAGWVVGDGKQRPHRYWSYLVTDTEEILDEESGYSVTVVSEREERVPVVLTHL